MRISVGHHLFRKSESSSQQYTDNSKFDVSLRVCHRSKCGNYVAVTDWTKSLTVSNPKKPEVYTVDELNNLIREKKLQVEFHSLPTEMTVTDEAFIKQYGKKRLGWLKKRDIKFRKIESLTTKDLIEKYLYGGGLFDEMKQLVQAGEGWKSVGAYVNVLNRFIVFGATPNADNVKLVCSPLKGFLRMILMTPPGSVTPKSALAAPFSTSTRSIVAKLGRIESGDCFTPSK
mgnify:CR=1 FL=1